MTKKEKSRIASTMRSLVENIINNEINNRNYWVIWSTDGFLGDELILPKEDESTTFLGYAWLTHGDNSDPTKDYVLRCRISCVGTIHISIRDMAGNRLARQSFSC